MLASLDGDEAPAVLVAPAEPTPDVAPTDDGVRVRTRSALAVAMARRQSVPAEVLIVFSRQLGSFLEAGISVIEALDIVGEETTSERMRDVIADMRETVLRGGSFSDAVDAHPTLFPGWYRAMVRSAGFTGRLDEVLAQLAAYLERDQEARRQVKSALTYPTFVLIIAIAAMIVMSIFVLPKFSAMYDKLGAELPLPTRILLGWTGFVQTAWPFLLAIGAAGALFLAIWFGGEGTGKRRRDQLAMRAPVVGTIYHLICVERFSRVLAALTAAGVPLPDGIEMSARSTNNTIFFDRMAEVREALLRGEGIVRPLTDTELIPTAALQMIRVGERTGMLAVQLGKAAAFFEREVAFRIKKATSLFQPTVIMFVGLLIGFVAIAQVSAMYSIFGRVNR